MEIKCGRKKRRREKSGNRKLSEHTKRRMSNALEMPFCAFDIGFENSLAVEE